MAESKENERCVLCLNDKSSPVFIQCGHSFCCDCLEEYKSYRRYAWARKCPICRCPFIEENSESSILEELLSIVRDDDAVPNIRDDLEAHYDDYDEEDEDDDDDMEDIADGFETDLDWDTYYSNEDGELSFFVNHTDNSTWTDEDNAATDTSDVEVINISSDVEVINISSDDPDEVINISSDGSHTGNLLDTNNNGIGIMEPSASETVIAIDDSVTSI